MKKHFSLIASSMVGSALTLAAVNLYNLGPQVVTLKQAADAPQVYRQTAMPDALNNIPVDFSATAEKTTPAVVFIKSVDKGQVKATAPRSGQKDPFEEMFGQRFFFFGEPGMRGGQPMPRQSSGSGVIVSADGYIVTNNHVIDGASEVEVILSDNRKFKAKVIGTDPSTDLALIQIKGSNFPHITFANSDQVKVGNWVLAIGNPFNLSSTVTAGVVSAKSRNLRLLHADAPIESFIQTDAAVNPGNSGGALVNMNGDLVGINTAIQSPTGTYAGYAFAVPANIVKKVVEDLVKYGVVQRGYLGLVPRDLDATLAKEHNLNIYEGAWVDTVLANSAAADAGVKKGDVVIKIDGVSIKGEAGLRESIGRKRPGDKVALTIIRNNQEKLLTASLKNKDGNTGKVEKASADSFASLGIELAEIEATEARKLEISGGVKVTTINAGIIQQQTDMRNGFIITAIDKEPVNTVAEAKRLLKSRKGGVLLEGVYADYPGKYFYGFGIE